MRVNADDNQLQIDPVESILRLSPEGPDYVPPGGMLGSDEEQGRLLYIVKGFNQGLIKIVVLAATLSGLEYN